MRNLRCPFMRPSPATSHSPRELRIDRPSFPPCIARGLVDKRGCRTFAVKLRLRQVFESPPLNHQVHFAGSKPPHPPISREMSGCHLPPERSPIKQLPKEPAQKAHNKTLPHRSRIGKAIAAFVPESALP